MCAKPRLAPADQQARHSGERGAGWRPCMDHCATGHSRLHGGPSADRPRRSGLSLKSAQVPATRLRPPVRNRLAAGGRWIRTSSTAAREPKIFRRTPVDHSHIRTAPEIGIKLACAILLQEWWAPLRPVLSASDPPGRAAFASRSYRPAGVRQLLTSKAANHSPIALRVCSVTSNCTGRPVFF